MIASCLALAGLAVDSAAAADVRTGVGAPAHGRAWELVTVGESDGVAPASARTWTEDGNAIAFLTRGPMPGAVSGEVLAHNLAVRDVGGWEHHPVGNPFTVPFLHIGTSALATSADLSTWLWSSASPLLPDAPPPSVMGVYRRAPDGTLTLLGHAGIHSLLTNIALHAVSDDARHAGLNSRQVLLPVDAARIAGRAAYEYAGTTMRLAGVDDSGRSLSVCGSVFGDGGDPLNAPNAISADGSRVFLTSPDPDATVCLGVPRVYLREGGDTRELSASRCTRPDCNAPARVSFAGATPDGSRVFLATAQQLTNDDQNAGADLYRYDVAHGTLTRLSTGAEPPDVALPIRTSADGQRVYFATSRQLIAGEGSQDGPNVYLAEGSELRFVASLAESETLRPSATSEDGTVLLFATTARLLGSDVDESTDVYRYDARRDELEQVSLGGPGTGSGAFDARIASVPNAFPEQAPGALVADGDRAFIVTEEALVPADVNGTTDVYEWSAGTTELVTSGGGSSAATFAGASADGRSVFFLTAESLLPGDRDAGDVDLYAARLGGGFDDPAAPPPPCAGDACQGPLPERLRRRPPDTSLVAASPRVVRGPRAGGPVLRRAGARVRRRLARRGRAILVVDVPRAGDATLVARAWIDGRHRVVAATSATADAEGPLNMTLRLSATAREALRRRGSLALRLTARQHGAQDAYTMTLTRRRTR